VATLTISGIVREPSVNMHGAEWITAWLPRLARRIDMRPVGEVRVELYPHWKDKAGVGAPSAVLFIEESAIVVHLYPEADFIDLYLHSCKAIPNWEWVAETIVRELRLDTKWCKYEGAYDWRTLAYGPPHEPETWPAAIRALLAA
jgi:S-adenosylmethionine/arginine decarboxylase-like enzyme